jgi:predicted nucleic acid-binding protein
MVLVDAGPLVALIHAGDRHHKRCTETFRALAQPLATVWPAFTEAMYLLGFAWRAQDALWQLVEREAVEFVPLESRDFQRARELMRKYRDLPMDLADAALVAVAERERETRIFTLDRRDFSLYRPAGIGRFQIIPTA